MAGRLAAVTLCVGLTAGLGISHAAADPAPKDVLKVYADIAQAGYTDSVDTARTLKLAVDAFLAKPTEDNLRAARAAWIAARIPYMQTEAYRFGNAIVDDWEGKVNSWPLDEGLIDYVAAAYGTESPENELYVANVIAHTSLTIGGKKLDTSKITKELLADKLQEAGGVEANVATGYHAVEFLLWGQDLNGTGPGNGARPATDFDTKKCTNGNCARRAQYLRAATDLLVDDLAWMAAQWAPGGEARKTIEGGSDEAGLTAIMTGLGSLSYGELAGERMKLGLMIHDPEEEHDCFSDNTHASHFFDALGIRNVYLGTYRRADRIHRHGAERLGPRARQVARGRCRSPRQARRDHGRHERDVSPRADHRVLRSDDRRGERGGQRRGAEGRRCAARPDQVDRARGGDSRPQGHRVRRLRQPRQSVCRAGREQRGRRGDKNALGEKRSYLFY